MKITRAMVLEVQRLLQEGKLSQRQVARVTGISRSTIGQIASGRRPAWEDRRHDDDDPLSPTGEIARCPGCGGRVYMPCRLCHVRKSKSLGPAPLRPKLSPAVTPTRSKSSRAIKLPGTKQSPTAALHPHDKTPARPGSVPQHDTPERPSVASSRSELPPRRQSHPGN